MERFRNKVWLSSPTMHGPELEYMKQTEFYIEAKYSNTLLATCVALRKPE